MILNSGLNMYTFENNKQTNKSINVIINAWELFTLSAKKNNPKYVIIIPSLAGSIDVMFPSGISIFGKSFDAR